MADAVRQRPRHFMPNAVNLRLLQMWADQNDLDLRQQAGVVMHHQERQARRRRRRRRFWVVSWLTYEQKMSQGDYHQLLRHLEENDVPAFVRYLRFEPAMFREMEARLHPLLLKEDTNMRRAIQPGERLAITLRFLATGETFRSLAFQFRVAHNTISGIIPEVCEAIIAEFGPEVIPQDLTENDWLEYADDFLRYWNFPHVLAAMDGKHVSIACPPNTGSIYYNYKKFYSIILFALVDAKYRFIYVDIGRNGACSDAQVFAHSTLKEAIDSGAHNWPAPSPLPNDVVPVPYYILGDDAFGLKPWLMKPYSRRNLTRQEHIFNYRLSRARRVVENAFGILVKRFRCLLKTMEVGPEAASRIVLTCVILHNLMRERYPRMQDPYGDRVDKHGRVIPGGWRDRPQLVGGQNLPGGNFGTQEAKGIRGYLKDYFNSRRGSVSWQNRMIE